MTDRDWFLQLVIRAENELGVYECEVLRRAKVSRETMSAWRTGTRGVPTRAYKRILVTLTEMLAEHEKAVQMTANKRVKNSQQIRKELETLNKRTIPESLRGKVIK